MAGNDHPSPEVSTKTKVSAPKGFSRLETFWVEQKIEAETSDVANGDLRQFRLRCFKGALGRLLCVEIAHYRKFGGGRSGPSRVLGYLLPLLIGRIVTGCFRRELLSPFEAMGSFRAGMFCRTFFRSAKSNANTPWVAPPQFLGKSARGAAKWDGSVFKIHPCKLYRSFHILDRFGRKPFGGSCIQQ